MCSRCLSAFRQFFERVFGSLGSGIARYPWITIILCSVFASGCGIGGFAFLHSEDRVEKLYIPQDSIAIKDLTRAKKYFPILSREEQVLLIPQKGDTILTRQCLLDVLNIHSEVTSLENYEKYCLKGTTDSCLFINPLEVFGFNSSNVVDVLSQLTSAHKNLGQLMRNGRPVHMNFPRMFGNVKWNKTSGALQSASAIQISYSMNGEDDKFDEVFEWEKKFIDKLISLKDKLTCSSMYYSAGRSLSDATSESSMSDITLISITFTLMISFACTLLGKFRNPLVGHSLLANAGILAVGLGILAGLGLSMLVGVPFISIVGVLPFLILGIGIDDMFIIIDELDRQNNRLTVVDTVKTVMSHSGATVTMTTVTDLVAFVVSTSTSFNSIRYFCIYAALAVTFSYFMVITFFVAFLTFDVRRIKTGRRDCLPVCYAPPPKEGEAAWDEPRAQISNNIMKAWAKVLMLPPVRLLVVLVSVGLVTASVFGAKEISQSFDRSILAKDGSPYKQFINMEEKYFSSNIEVSIINNVQTKYEDVVIQSQVLNLSTIATTNNYYENTSLSWMAAMKSFSQMSRMKITGSNFMPALNIFLGVPAYAHFKEDVKLSADNTTVKASRVLCYMKGSSSSMFQKDAMLTLRSDLAKHSGMSVYAIAPSFIYFEQYVIIMTETIRNLVIAGVTVFVVTWPFLLSFTVTMIVFFNFVALIFELFALMWLWGVSLNSVSMINLVMAIGFSVDYSAHIAHAFVMSPEFNPEDRVITALSTVGASVLMGGISTFLGMVVTGFASSEIFRIFFKMFVGIVGLGLLHGLSFLPVYLSLLCRWPPIKVQTVNDSHNHSVGVSNRVFEPDPSLELNAGEIQVHGNLAPIFSLHVNNKDVQETENTIGNNNR